MPIGTFAVVLIAAGVVGFLGARKLRRPWLSLLVATLVGPVCVAIVVAGSKSKGGLGALAEALFVGVTLMSALAGGVGVLLAAIIRYRERND
jgi:hypothetical protein